MIKTTKPNLDSPVQLVINWHLTEVCNYSCQYCYAKWDKVASPRELIHSAAQRKELVQSLYDFFRPDNLHNPLRKQMPWDSVRLNIAGGEPLMYVEETSDVIHFASDIGFDVSIITNGSHLTESMVADIGPKLTMIGVSIDSAQKSVNRQIGRVDRRPQQTLLDTTELTRLLKLAKSLNPDMRLKLNTVVNALNYGEDMSSLITNMSPDKWKVLRMLPVINNNLAVSDAEFSRFVEKHSRLRDLMQVEDNDSITESYIMVDPLGRFFQNGNGQLGYAYSTPILETGVLNSFKGMTFRSGKFLNRYWSADELAPRRLPVQSQPPVDLLYKKETKPNNQVTSTTEELTC